jgi:cysteine dioxygenase
MADVLGLHSIANPSLTEYAVSLHLYTPPNAALRGCKLFNAENGEARHVMQGDYDSVRGVVPSRRRLLWRWSMALIRFDRRFG